MSPTPNPGPNGQPTPEEAKALSDHYLALGKPETFRADLSNYGPTDDGVGRHIGGQLLGSILHTPKTGETFVWDQSRWRLDDVAAGKALVREECVKLVSEEHGSALRWADRHNETADKKVTPEEHTGYKRMRAYLSRGKQEAVCNFVKEDPRHTVPVSIFDTHTHLLVTPGATVDLRTGQVSPPNPAHRMTQRTQVRYDPRR